MLRHSRLWVLGATLLLGLVLVGTGLAQQAANPPGAPPGGQPLLTPDDRAAIGQIWWQRVKERLSLSDDQVSDIRNLLQTQRTAAQADIHSLVAARRQLRTLLEQQPSDPATIQSTATQVKTLQAKLFDARLQMQLALRAKFSPEQWQGWLTLRKDMGHRWMRRGRGIGPGAL